MNNKVSRWHFNKQMKQQKQLNCWSDWRKVLLCLCQLNLHHYLICSVPATHWLLCHSKSTHSLPPCSKPFQTVLYHLTLPTHLPPNRPDPIHSLSARSAYRVSSLFLASVTCFWICLAAWFWWSLQSSCLSRWAQWNLRWDCFFSRYKKVILSPNSHVK